MFLTLNDDSNFYDLLEIRPDATAQEIRTAYLRAKVTYKKDSAAVYTLMNEQETVELLNRIEEAFLILSNPDKRREYDRSHGLLVVDERELEMTTPPHRQNVLPIDRSPPVEVLSSVPEMEPTVPSPSLVPAQTPPGALPIVPKFTDDLAQSIAEETEWRGAFLKKVRETRKVSIEELADVTRINKAYLHAIEDEVYEKLPAPVFLRGFLAQIAKQLRLPSDKLTATYLGRVQEARSGKDKSKPLW